MDSRNAVEVTDLIYKITYSMVAATIMAYSSALNLEKMATKEVLE